MAATRHANVACRDLSPGLLELGAHPLGEPVDDVEHSLLAHRPLPHREEVLVLAWVHRSHLDGVDVVELPDGGEQERADARLDTRPSRHRLVDPVQAGLAKPAQCIGQGPAGEDAERLRLLQ